MQRDTGYYYVQYYKHDGRTGKKTDTLIWDICHWEQIGENTGLWYFSGHDSSTPESFFTDVYPFRIQMPDEPNFVIPEHITQYLKHLPTCNTMKDWSEANQAMADTPTIFRDEDYYAATEELRHKQTLCTCGLDNLLTVNKNKLANILPDSFDVANQACNYAGLKTNASGIRHAFAEGAKWAISTIISKLNLK